MAEWFELERDEDEDRLMSSMLFVAFPSSSSASEDSEDSEEFVSG